MFKLNQFQIMIRFFVLALLSTTGLSACRQITAETSTLSTTATSNARFASGTKGVKIITSDGASFTNPTTLPISTTIPSTFPGYDGTSTYLPGVSASTFYDLDGTTQITKPSWLLDFQVGITSTSYSGACAAFGGGVSDLDPDNFFRVSESNCGAVANGSGSGTDPVFLRILLDRSTSEIGSAENLLVQVEYQASSLHLNSDGTGTNEEDNVDQLWKIYWGSSLANTATPKTFGLFVPPNYSACIPSGTSTVGAGGASDNCASATYRGSPVKVRQFLIPLSAYPDMKVIQFSRKQGRITQVGGAAYVSAFCSTDEPLCLGVVIRSVTITRM